MQEGQAWQGGGCPKDVSENKLLHFSDTVGPYGPRITVRIIVVVSCLLCNGFTDETMTSGRPGNNIPEIAKAGPEHSLSQNVNSERVAVDRCTWMDGVLGAKHVQIGEPRRAS